MTVAVGFFDGVHLGHQEILKGADVAFTFENHPLSFLAPERAPRLIMGWEERVKAIQALGPLVTAIGFNEDIANCPPERFLEKLKDFATVWTARLKMPATPLRICCGENWRFGKGGIGDADFARAHGFEVMVAPYVDYEGEPISSTRIRTALETGEIERANAMTGRHFKVEGRVFEGKGEGAKLGFPTINLKAISTAGKVQLPLGVYEISYHGRKAIANLGRAPTFAERSWNEPVWEVHVLEGPIISETQEAFAVVRFIRPEKKFASIEDLKRQIAVDCGIIST